MKLYTNDLYMEPFFYESFVYQKIEFYNSFLMAIRNDCFIYICHELSQEF